MSGTEDADYDRREYRPPHSGRHPIPTIERYRDEKQQRQADASEAAQHDDAPPNAREKLAGASNTLHLGGEKARQHHSLDTYQSQDQTGARSAPDATAWEEGGGTTDDETTSLRDDVRAEDPSPDTHVSSMENLDPRAKRKQMKQRKAERAEREVTDPVTHLPVKIHDFTGSDLKIAPRHASSPAPDQSKDGQKTRATMEHLFPPPQFDVARDGLVQVLQKALTIGLSVLLLLSTILLAFLAPKSTWFQLVASCLGLLGYALLGSTVTWGLRGWLDTKVRNVWEDHVWEAKRQQSERVLEDPTPESTHWLNSLLGSIWPLVNPDLFTSLADTLEDVMQASLPKLVRMVSVEDIGQGSESLRILGVRWLPSGAASESVTVGGTSSDDDKAGGSTNPSSPPAEKQDEQSSAVVEGLEAEEGDFLNLEIAFAYRARAEAHGLRKRAKNMHLYLGFYLPANIKLLEISCAPLSRHGLNIMDLPLISNFVQSSVDAAVSEYVAPKSLTLDLKDMLVGDDFKKDTGAKGVLVVRIKRAYGFKEGDVGIAMVRKGSSDPYVTVGWSKFGKPVWATRMILTDMEPSWEETGFVLVTAQELNVDEKLQVQLWDSDRTTADDQLGHIDLDLKKIMRSSASNNRMQDRSDGFSSIKAGDTMPGTLEWSVGYFSKLRILPSQLEQQTQEPDINSEEQLKEKVFQESEQKLREATQDESDEVEQQKNQDLKEREDQLLISSPPSKDYPSGVLSIQIHQILGLELETIRKRAGHSEDGASSDEESDDLPSSYCCIILNHRNTFKTRTKPKNSKPFFNAGCERFIRDWPTAEVHIAVRDARVHEDDALIGVVHLPLSVVFADRSQVNRFFPISGGVGFGRVRLSMVFRSVKFQPQPTDIGWEYGTLDIDSAIQADGLPRNLHGYRMKVSTGLGHGTFYPDGPATWKAKKERAVHLAVRKRHSSPLVLEFRHSKLGPDATEAFAVLWLKDIRDETSETVRLSVWKGDLERARKNCLESYGEKLGEVQIRLKLWRGLSAYHYGLARRDPNVAHVMDVLDATNDQDEIEREVDGGERDTDSSSSSSDSDKDTTQLEADGKRGPKEQFKEYKANRRQLHRRNRGIMQWRGARAVPWLSHKVDHGQQRFHDLFRHREREPTVEMEV